MSQHSLKTALLSSKNAPMASTALPPSRLRTSSLVSPFCVSSPIPKFYLHLRSLRNLKSFNLPTILNNNVLALELPSRGYRLLYMGNVALPRPFGGRIPCGASFISIPQLCCRSCTYCVCKRPLDERWWLLGVPNHPQPVLALCFPLHRLRMCFSLPVISLSPLIFHICTILRPLPDSKPTSSVA